MAERKRLQINVPDSVEGGVYANAAGVWHTPHEFTLDFLTIQPSSPESPDVVPARVVSRVKIPPTVIFDLMRALNENMTKYESTFGTIKRIEPLQAPESDETEDEE
jgi:hypothetical protein